MSFSPAPMVRGVIASLLLVLNTLLWCAPLFVLALVKLLLPFAAVRARIDPLLNAVAVLWVTGNDLWLRWTQRTHWDIEVLDGVDPDGWYLVSCNHQSWADIFVLQRLLNRRIPLMKFFLKYELIYVPIMGLAWWALDFPFMRRYSDRYLRRHPEKGREDLETIRRACARFAKYPTSVMNFVEGTRFTAAKREAQRSPYRHLLKPKVVAMALTLNGLGERFESLIDVTIVYPEGIPGFWKFLCGDIGHIVVRARRLSIPPEFFHSDAMSDSRARKRVQAWLHELWLEKDRQIDELLQLHAAPESHDRATAIQT